MKKLFAFYLPFFSVLFLVSPSAWAGYWQLDYYVYSHELRTASHIRVNQSNGQGNEVVAPLSNIPKTQQDTQVTKYGMHVDLLYYHGYVMTMSADEAYARVAVTPYYKWVGTGEPTERFYICERSELAILSRHKPDNRDNNQGGYTIETPYDGHGVNILEANNGFNDTLQDWGHVDWYWGSFTPQPFLYSKGIVGYHLTMVETNKKTVAHGETRNLSISVKTPGWSFGPNWYGYWPEASTKGHFGYQAQIANVSINIKRRGSLPNTGYSTLAAGAKPSDEHIADVEFYVTAPVDYWGATIPIPGAKITPSVKLLYGEGIKGKEGDAVFTANQAIEPVCN